MKTRALVIIPLALCGCGFSLQTASDVAALAQAAAQCGLDVDQAIQAGDTDAQVLLLATTDPSCAKAAVDVAALISDVRAKKAARR